MIGWLVLCIIGARAQNFPLDLKQDEVNYNPSSASGLPLSDTTGDPEGSNGKGPAVDATLGAPKAHQLRTAVTFGHVLKRTNDTTQFPSDTYGSTSTPKFVLRRAAIGAPYIARASSYLIGAVIPPPSEDENGDELADGVSAEEYWFLEPDDADNSDNNYYWSRHAASVFAIKAGSVNITWVKRTAETSVPSDATDTDKWLVTDSGTYFRKYAKSYIVSGSAIKDPQKVFWNRSPYAGPTIDIPSSRIGSVHFAYHSSFPENVAEDQVASGLPINDPSLTRTVWFETGGFGSRIQAQNVEGRIFMEILGDVVSTGESGDVREHLGFEVLDVLKYPTPENVTVELGDPLVSLSGDTTLLPVPQDPLTSLNFAYQHSIEGVEIPTYYSIRTTANANDLLVHWMIEGEQEIRWPFEYLRYTAVWPTNVSRYSHYIRPAADTQQEAEATAVPLYSLNTPAIAFQDAFDQPRAKLTSDYRFYTWLDATYPAHRALLQFSSGDEVAFERVYSWLDDSLLALANTNLTISATPRTVITDGGTTEVNDLPFVLDTAYQTVVADGIAYVCSSAGTVQVINVTDPDSPWVIRTLDTETIPTLDGQLIMTLSDGILFVSSYHAGAITVFDTSKLVDTDTFANPETTVIGILKDNSTTADTSATGQVVEATHLSQIGGTIVYQTEGKTYLYAAGNEDHLVIFDVSDIDAITLVAETAMEFDGTTFANLRAEAVEGDLAFVVSTTSSAVLFVSLTDPEAPVVLSVIQDDVGDFTRLASPGSLSVGDNVLFVASGSESAVTVVDFSDVTSPRWLAEMRDGEGGFEFLSIRGTVLNDGILFISSTSNNKLNVADVSNPANPYLLKVITQGDTDFPTLRSPRGVTVDGNTVYVSLAGSDGVAIFDYASVRKISETYSAVDMADTVAADLAAYDSETGTLTWPDELISPRVYAGTIEVGKRIVAPSGETGAADGDDYLAGYVNQDVGTSFNPNAYVDPLNPDNDFGTANSGAIIPVNAIPGANTLEVWWLRPNGADTAAGFKATYWPSVIGRYTIEWPVDPPEIVLASNDGSGALASEPATGDIYYQNDASLPGYNPNEEHALMSGGQAYALRDDLNLISSTTPAVLEGSSATYSSEPHVLLEYTESDGRPAMIAFKVLREKPEEGIMFEYDIEAGTLLQPPLPLTFLSSSSVESAILAITDSGTDASSLLSTLTVTARPGVESFENYLLQNTTDAAQNAGFYVTALDYSANQLSGYVSTDGNVYEITHQQFAAWRRNQHASNSKVRVEVFNGSGIPDDLVADGDKVLLISPAEGRAEVYDLIDTKDNRLFVELPAATTSNQDEGAFESATHFVFLKADVADGDFASTTLDWRVTSTLAVSPDDAAEAYFQYTLEDRKGGRWVYRGPHDAADGDRFRVHYQYETLDGFYFPGETTQPGVGTLTPYLRSTNTAGEFVGGAYEGSGDDVQPFPVTYVPTWPTDAPELHRGETLTLARRGLPAVRGNSSLEIVYDQALANSDLADQSVILHDPTREKEYELGTTNTVDGTDYVMDKIPASVATSTYNGDVFFPNLPPHLSERFFMDPDRGASGALVFGGKFFEETVGEDYVMLNVAGQKDLEALYSLCDTNDADYALWTNAVNQLKTTAEVYVEDPDVPGTYIAASDVQAKVDAGAYADDPDNNIDTLTRAQTALAAVPARYVDGDGNVTGFTGYIGDLMEVTDDDTAVDSYALTSTGLGTGYVSILAGNGQVFTPTDDPVSILVLKVVDTLHPGEIKVVLPPNPLSEKVTVQQVVDLAGKARDEDENAVPLYAFDWRLAAPEDGLAPDVFDYQVAKLWNNQSWTHVPLPTHADTVSGIATVASTRTTTVTTGAGVTVLENLEVASYTAGTESFDITLNNRPADLAEGNLLTITDANGDSSDYYVDADSTTADITVTLSTDYERTDIASVTEVREADIPQSYLLTEFDAPNNYSELWFSLNLDTNKLGVRVYLNGTEVIVAGINNLDTNVTDTTTGTQPDGLDPDFAPVGETYLVSRDLLTTDGSANQVVVALYTTENAVVGDSETFDFKIEALEYVDIAAGSTKWITMDKEKFLDGIRAIVGDTADVQSLSDQHIIMRYGPANPAYADGDSVTNAATEWSEWTEPQLVEGWIKRVLAGINPFNQRTTDLFNNAVDTDSSMLTLAGPRWEGDVALNSDTIDDAGLIEIYETVLNRGRGLSIDAGINYGPANDALLLAAGYINDLYMFLGNEAWSDALNPTIGIGTSSGEFGDVATALFAFKGQVASLLEEELALLRGRDDFLPPGVEATPVYNRLFWNYTRGIDSGEVIYALNYNVQEEQGEDLDGIVSAEDAAALYPQGHGDAYGHFLTALKGYYSLLIDADFDWVPRTEGVLILNQTVQVDYTDERKFASAAAAVARAGKQTFDLTWRKDYQTGDDVGWEHFGAEAVRDNSERLTSRYWGVDHWASRTGQGAFINWVTGNAMLPEIDDDPEHEGIQVIDRTTVPELTEIAELGRELQTSMDNADAHLNPLGLSDRSMAFDVNPTSYSFWQGESSHFEQVYDRAKLALENAVTAFDDAKDVTRLMRGELTDLSDLRALVLNQELAYTNALIEIYGTPYTDDIGVGKTYETGYAGPDLTHYNYIDIEELDFGDVLNPANVQTFTLSTNVDFESFYNNSEINEADMTRIAEKLAGSDNTFSFTLGTHGFFSKPSDWTGDRESPGQIQLVIADIVKARNEAYAALRAHEDLNYRLSREVDLAIAQFKLTEFEQVRASTIRAIEQAQAAAQGVYESVDRRLEAAANVLEKLDDAAIEALPKSFIVGFSSGGDLSGTIRGIIKTKSLPQTISIRTAQQAALVIWLAEHIGNSILIADIEKNELFPERLKESAKQWLHDVNMTARELQRSATTVNAALQALADAKDRYSALVAKGDRLQAEREIFRKQLAAKVQGFRTRDAAFRFFRDEKLERYNALFDLAARYAFLAAQAFDYETGLLGTEEGTGFIDRIVGSRALGVVTAGEPQFAGSDTGDPGLSSTLAEMSADFSVLKGRLGINNPDIYSTTVSLRTENFRILPGSDGDTNWRDVLDAGRVSNLLEDEDIVRHCMQINTGDGLQVPGIVIEFSTQITDGDNLFGQPLAGGDHAFDISSFATKIFSVGVVMEGYNGMDDPAANAATTDGSSTSDPTAAFLDSTTLSATPYVYLIPVGLDVMRSPALGDQSEIRTWSVDDVTIPLPFNVGASEFSTKQLYQSDDSLTEDLFGIRKHQAFRPVSDAALFSENGQLLPSEYTASRLIGRSVWNTKWKLVIPGRTLLNDPEQGLDVLVDTLSDIKLHFQTYSYAGN